MHITLTHAGDMFHKVISPDDYSYYMISDTFWNPWVLSASFEKLSCSWIFKFALRISFSYFISAIP